MHCKKVITPEEGYRGRFFPKTGKFIHLHYYCAWEVTFADIEKLAGRLGY